MEDGLVPGLAELTDEAWKQVLILVVMEDGLVLPKVLIV